MSLSLTWDPTRMTCHAHQLKGEGLPIVEGLQRPAAGLQPTSILTGLTRPLQPFDILCITLLITMMSLNRAWPDGRGGVNCKSP